MDNTFEIFVEFLNRGATETEAIMLTGYEEGLITKGEAISVIGETRFSDPQFQKDLPDATVWESLPALEKREDWNEWFLQTMFQKIADAQHR